MADAAGVEADQVEATADFGAREVRDRHAGDHVDRRRPGAARIDQQGSDPRSPESPEHANHRELYLRASRIRVVDRYRDDPALRRSGTSPTES